MESADGIKLPQYIQQQQEWNKLKPTNCKKIHKRCQKGTFLLEMFEVYEGSLKNFETYWKYHLENYVSKSS